MTESVPCIESFLFILFPTFNSNYKLLLINYQIVPNYKFSLEVNHFEQPFC